jgi:uncharacterized protein
MDSSSQPSRLQVIDALRAFALLGIVINHVSIEYVAGFIPDGYTNQFSALDRFVAQGADILTFGKFFTIFSFLFGLSFAIQISSATARSDGFTLRFLWRLAILFGIGFVHSMFYSGDILCIYAVLGLVLLACRKLGNKALVVTGLFLVLNIPTQILRVASYRNPPSAAELQAEKQREQQFLSQAARDFNTKRFGTVNEVVALNMASGFQMRLLFQLMTGRLFITAGLFLLGFAAGRASLFVDSPHNRHFFRRLLIASAAAAVIATPLAWILNPTIFGDPRQFPVLLGLILFDVHQATLSAVYLAGFTLLYWKRPTGPLRALVPAGQMGLTVYLTQSVAGVLAFFGFGLGLMGKMGITLEIALAVAFYGFQIWLAGLWMRRFRLGPVEWLWRTLTYGRLQKFRRTTDAARAASA